MEGSLVFKALQKRGFVHISFKKWGASSIGQRWDLVHVGPEVRHLFAKGLASKERTIGSADFGVRNLVGFFLSKPCVFQD